MELIFASDSTLRDRVNTLTYGELWKTLPRVEARHLPRPERLLRDYASDLFLSATDGYATISVFSTGLFHYREDGGATAYTVSGCKDFTPRFMSKPLYMDETIMSEAWYVPLALIGSLRVEHNRNRNEERKISFHYTSESIGLSTMPRERNFTDAQEENGNGQTRRRAVRKQAGAIRKELTGRQEQILHYLYDLGMKQARVAELLGTSQANISAIAGRAFRRSRKNHPV